MTKTLDLQEFRRFRLFWGTFSLILFISLLVTTKLFSTYLEKSLLDADMHMDMHMGNGWGRSQARTSV